MSLRLTVIISLLTILTFAACSGPEPMYDLSRESYSLVNADSQGVTFPNDFHGNYALVTFIYTNCPDMCRIITANMGNIQRNMADTSGVDFIEISFDPERDHPSALRDYKKTYGLNEQFTLLTGDSTTVNSLLDRLDIMAVKTYPDSVKTDSSNYAMKHSNTLYLMDTEGRILSEYPASVVPPKNVIEDLNKLRN